MKRINKDDIIIRTKIRTMAGTVLPYLEYDWKIDLYVNPVVKLTASRLAGITTNCSVVGEDILVYVDGFDWGYSGVVTQETTVYFPDINFKDGNFKARNVQNLNLVIE